MAKLDSESSLGLRLCKLLHYMNRGDPICISLNHSFTKSIIIIQFQIESLVIRSIPIW